MSAPADAGTARAPGLAAALRDVHGLGPVLVSQGLESFGGAVFLTAALWEGYRQTQSSLAVALVVAGASLATLAGLGVGGIIADRHDPRRTAIALRLLSALAALALVAQSGGGGVVLLIVCACFLAGLLGASGPVGMCLLVATAGQQRRVEGLAMLTGAGRVSQAGGPLLAGLLLAADGPSSCHLVAAGLFVVSAGALGRVPGVRRPVGADVHEPPEAPEAVPPVVVPDALPAEEGETVIAVIKRRPAIRAAIVLDSYVMVAAAPFALLPALATRLEMGAGGYGLLMAAPALGAVVGLGLTRWFSRLTWYSVMLVGSGTWCVCVAGLGLTEHALVAVLALLVAGGGDLWSETARGRVVNDEVPDEVRGRVLGVWLACASTAPVLGGLVMGVAATVVGLPLALAGGGAAGLAGVLLLARRWRHTVALGRWAATT